MVALAGRAKERSGGSGEKVRRMMGILKGR